MSVTAIELANLSDMIDYSNRNLPNAFALECQPIVDFPHSRVIGYDVVIKGEQGQTANELISSIKDPNKRFHFDLSTRFKVLNLAKSCNINKFIFLNLVHTNIDRVSEAAEITQNFCFGLGLSPARVVFQYAEGRSDEDINIWVDRLQVHRCHGFRESLEGFGSGFASLTKLSRFQPHFAKLDEQFIKNIENDELPQAILRCLLETCTDMRIALIVRGVQSKEQALCLSSLGVRFMQGSYFGVPELNAFPRVATDLFGQPKDYDLNQSLPDWRGGY